MPLSASGNTEVYAFGGFSDHFGTGNAFWRYLDSTRNWQEIYPEGFLPEFDPTAKDYSATGGIRTTAAGWTLDFGRVGAGRRGHPVDRRTPGSKARALVRTIPAARGGLCGCRPRW